MTIDMEEELKLFLRRIREYDESSQIDKICLAFAEAEFLQAVYDYVDQEAANSPVVEELEQEAYQEGYSEGHAEGYAEAEEALREDGIV